VSKLSGVEREQPDDAVEIAQQEETLRRLRDQLDRARIKLTSPPIRVFEAAHVAD
jgi:hypothetical protein